jgi:uncharacterized MAPEG superfamily protein
MTTALWCVLAAGLLPYVATMLAKSKSGFDNRRPRDWLHAQDGFRRRANAAQLNSFESFPLFAAAVLIAQYLKAPQHTLNVLALGFVAARILFMVFYVADKPALRSLVWFVGIGCCVGIFVVAA